MSWLAKIWGFFFGSGTVVSAVADGLKLADDVVSAQHDKAQRDAGAAEQVIASEKDTQKTIDSVNAPVSSGYRDKLWDAYVGKAGSDK